MAELSYYWGGTALGDAVQAPYSDDEFSDIWRKLFMQDRTRQGVVGGYANELEVTNPVGTTVRVDTGAALVDGKFYENDATVDFAAGVAGQAYRVVLRKTWATQQIRLALLGPAGVNPVPLTQTDGVTWEISLCRVTNAAGTLTLDNDFEWVMRPDVRSFFVPPISSINTTDGLEPLVWDATNFGLTMLDSKLCEVSGMFIVPDDYIEDLNINISPVLGAFAVGSIYSRLRYGYGICNTGGVSAPPLGYAQEALTSGVNDYSCLVGMTLSRLRRGGLVRLHFCRDATNVLDTLGADISFYGWRIDYDCIN